jgi:hypothetical protein
MQLIGIHTTTDDVLAHFEVFPLADSFTGGKSICQVLDLCRVILIQLPG